MNPFNPFEINTFSFLTSQPSEQESFLRLLKQGTEALKAPLPTLLPNPKSAGEVKLPIKSTTTTRKNHERQWKVIYLSLQELQKCDTPQGMCRIYVRTRSEEPSVCVPERLYSSLKYEIHHEIPASIFGPKTPVMMAKVQIVNPNNADEEICKTNGTQVIKGTSSMVAVTINQTMDALVCKQKVQFTDVSYHHEKKFFAFKISYYKPNNLKEPMLVMLSAPFQVFARRPRKVKKTKKRKSEAVEETQKKKLKKEETEADRIKKMKQEVKATALQQFLDCLERLIQHKNALSEADRRVALDEVQKKLFKNMQLQSQEHTEEPTINTFNTFELPEMNNQDVDLSTLDSLFA